MGWGAEGSRGQTTLLRIGVRLHLGVTRWAKNRSRSFLAPRSPFDTDFLASLALQTPSKRVPIRVKIEMPTRTLSRL